MRVILFDDLLISLGKISKLLSINLLIFLFKPLFETKNPKYPKNPLDTEIKKIFQINNDMNTFQKRKKKKMYGVI